MDDQGGSQGALGGEPPRHAAEEHGSHDLPRFFGKKNRWIFNILAATSSAISIVAIVYTMYHETLLHQYLQHDNPKQLNNLKKN